MLKRRLRDRHWSRWVICGAVVAAGPIARIASGQALPFFSGAEGFGGSFAGTAPAAGWFSNAQIYHVTTTADNLDGNGKPVQGTLRGAFYDYTNPSSPKQMATNRVVVFDVGGTFNLTQGEMDIKTVNNIYVAGQTAPSPVTVYGNTTQITHSNNTTNSNLILRYMTFRRGGAASGNTDALTFAGGSDNGTGSIASNLIVDHVSTSWATDEDLSVANGNTNITVQYAIIADSLRTDHAYGSLIRPRVNSSVTYAHDLYANNLSRNPRPGTYNGNTLNYDFENNVVYNWKNRAGYTGGASEPDTENVNLNFIGNYLIAGPSTPVGPSSSTAFTLDTSGDNVNLHVYQSSNAIDSDHGTNPGGVPNGTDTGLGMFVQNNGTTTAPLPAASVWAQPIGGAGNTGAPANTIAAPTMATQSAADAYTQVMNYVGNSWWSRDSIDTRIVNNVKTNTQGTQGVAATSPDPTELSTVLSAPTVSRPAGWDTDGDGMPDLWESAHGLNPSVASDGTADFDLDGYVNVTEYLDELGEFPAPSPIVFTPGTSSRYAQIGNWDIKWEPSRFDEAQVNTGNAGIDSVGQHANILRIATNPGNTAAVTMEGGWLRVESQVIIGNTPTSTATLTLANGILSTPLLSKGAGGVFNFIGGKLEAGTVAFSLTNQGGTISPGDSIGGWVSNVFTPSTGIGSTHVIGNLSLNSGTVLMELASTSNYDHLMVDGTATFGGTLQLSLLSFSPAAGNAFDLFDFGSASGSFTTLSLPALGGSLTWNTSQLYTTGIISVDGVIAASVWNHNGDGSWSNSANWDNGVPSGAGAVANFGTHSGSINAAAITVTLDNSFTVGSINFDNSATHYTIAAAATKTLTLDVGSGSAAINVLSGSHTISAPVILNKDTMITVTPASSTLAFTGTLTATGRNLSKAGAGTAQFENVQANSLTVTAGTVKISNKGSSNSAAGTSIVGSLSISGGAVIDLSNNALVINYSTLGTLLSDTRQELLVGKLTTSADPSIHALGYADNATLGRSTFGGVSVGSLTVLVGYTFAGDANLDGTVNALDFNAIAANYGGLSGKVWTQGDLNYDGKVSTADFDLLAVTFGSTMPQPAPGLGALVPEPGSMAILAGLAGLMGRRTRRKS